MGPGSLLTREPGLALACRTRNFVPSMECREVRESLIGLGFGLLCFAFVWGLVAVAMPADLVAREARLVSLAPDGTGVLDVSGASSLRTKVSGYKVGDSVPVWVNLIGGDVERLRDGPLKPSRLWILPAVLGALLLAGGLAQPKQRSDLTSLSETDR